MAAGKPFGRGARTLGRLKAVTVLSRSTKIQAWALSGEVICAEGCRDKNVKLLVITSRVSVRHSMVKGQVSRTKR